MIDLIQPDSERGTKHWWRVFHRTGIFPMDRLRSLPCVTTIDDIGQSVSGLYFLWSGPALLYVGQSVCIAGRVSQHEAARNGLRSGKPIPFRRATFIDITDSHWLNTDRQRLALDQVELAYIRKYRPPYNVKGLQ